MLDMDAQLKSVSRLLNRVIQVPVSEKFHKLQQSG